MYSFNGIKHITINRTWNTKLATQYLKYYLLNKILNVFLHPILEKSQRLIAYVLNFRN
jgi:hypothetical protein